MLSCVRAGSVPQRSSTGISGHQQVTDGSEEPQVGACPAQSAGMMHAAESNFGPEIGSTTPGSRWAATGVRNDRGTRPRTVEDGDRRSCHRRLLTWRFSRVFPGPQPPQFLAGMPGTDLARRKPVVPISSPTPKTADHIVASIEPAALTAVRDRAAAASSKHSPASKAPRGAGVKRELQRLIGLNAVRRPGTPGQVGTAGGW
jgi:hypothetical protein